VRIHIAFVLVVESALEVGDVDDRAQRLDLFRRHQARLHFHGLVHGALGLQHLPALGSRGQADAAGHVHADALAAFLLDLFVEADGVALQGRDVGIVVEGVEACRGVPGRAGRQLRALDQRDIGPAELAEVIEDARSDDAAADDDDAIVRFHDTTCCSAWRWDDCERPAPSTGDFAHSEAARCSHCQIAAALGRSTCRRQSCWMRARMTF
jgi:hypothetical protein